MANMSDDPSAGQNPQYGVPISYYLKTAASGDVRIQILDAKGKTLRTFPGTKNVGLNRVTWNLEGEQTTAGQMRTSPEYAPEIKVGPDGTRSAPGVGRLTILLSPGIYTVKLSADGREYQAPLVVKKDPNSGGTEADIAAQTTMMQELWTDLDNGSRMLNQIEFIRSQLLKLTSAPAPVKSAAEDIDKKLIDIEENLVQRKLTGQGQDTVRYPPKLLSKLAYLGNGLASSDFAPTKPQREVHLLLKGQLAELRQRLDAVLNKDLTAFDKLLVDNNVGIIKRTP
jgi:hypothetical protein